LQTKRACNNYIFSSAYVFYVTGDVKGFESEKTEKLLMERKKYLLITVVISICSLVFGQSNKAIYKAYAYGNMNKWKFSMDSVDVDKKKTNKDLLDLVNYQYGYIAWCIGNEKTDEAERYLKKATDNIEKLERQKYNLSMLYSYKAAFIGFEIGMAPYKAPFIGSKSLDYAKKSVSLDPLNPLGYFQLGNIAYYTPKIFGGSKNDAMEHYLKALKLMETNREYILNNWNYLNLLATIIKAYLELNEYEAAKKYCLKTLALEPGFDWVKNNLYPQVLKKMKK
jgi:tetratricopeptide (TPR) repeat protein